MANGRRYISFTAASFPTASRRFCVKLVWEQLSAAPLLSLTSGDTGTVDLSSSIKEELSLLSAPRLPELFYFLFFVSLKVSVLREIKSWRMEQHCSPQTVAPLTRLQTGLDVVSCGSWLFRRKKILIMIKKRKKERKKIQDNSPGCSAVEILCILSDSLLWKPRLLVVEFLFSCLQSRTTSNQRPLFILTYYSICFYKKKNRFKNTAPVFSTVSSDWATSDHSRHLMWPS